MSRHQAASPRVMGDLTRPYSWSDRFPYGFGATPEERLRVDLARVMTAHNVDGMCQTESIELASYLVACIDKKKRR